jgi:hypothetical protein
LTLWWTGAALGGLSLLCLLVAVYPGISRRRPSDARGLPPRYFGDIVDFKTESDLKSAVEGSPDLFDRNLQELFLLGHCALRKVKCVRWVVRLLLLALVLQALLAVRQA